MNKWEKLKIVFIGISTVIIPIVIAMVGHMFSRASTEIELQGKFIELSVRILEQKPTEYTENLRGWAVAVINQYSDVPINEETKEELIRRIPIFSKVSKSYKTEFVVGEQVTFNEVTIKFTSCEKVENNTICALSITPQTNISSIALLPSRLSPSTSSVKIESDEQVWSYDHGVPRQARFQLQQGVENIFKMIFESHSGGNPSHMVSILFYIGGSEMLADFYTDI